MLARLKTSLIVLATLFALLFFTICFHQREVLEATSILGKSIRQIEPEKKVTKLLILAYPRTGSSFVGDILSAHPNSSYLFEPLYEYFPYGYSVDYWPTWNSTVRDIVEEYMEKLFNCDEVSVNRNKHYFVRKNKRLNSCETSDPRVIKTIRLHKINLDPWIRDSDIKVIHLIRDPRAVYNSMSQKPEIWKGSLDHVEGMCQRMLNDTLLQDYLPSDRYFLLKYENLLTSPITTLVELFSHLNLDFDFTVADSLYNHTRISKSDEAQVHKFKSLKYYSTYRTADYDIYKWKTELPKKKIRYVEENCLNFMNLVGYEKYTS